MTSGNQLNAQEGQNLSAVANLSQTAAWKAFAERDFTLVDHHVFGDFGSSVMWNLRSWSLLNSEDQGVNLPYAANACCRGKSWVRRVVTKGA